MTDKQKNQIAVYRGQGLGYSVIAQMMGLSINTIKTHCRMEREHCRKRLRSIRQAGSMWRI